MTTSHPAETETSSGKSKAKVTQACDLCQSLAINVNASAFTKKSYAWWGNSDLEASKEEIPAYQGNIELYTDRAHATWTIFIGDDS